MSSAFVTGRFVTSDNHDTPVGSVACLSRCSGRIKVAGEASTFFLSYCPFPHPKIFFLFTSKVFGFGLCVLSGRRRVNASHPASHANAFSATTQCGIWLISMFCVFLRLAWITNKPMRAGKGKGGFGGEGKTGAWGLSLPPQLAKHGISKRDAAFNGKRKIPKSFFSLASSTSSLKSESYKFLPCLMPTLRASLNKFFFALYCGRGRVWCVHEVIRSPDLRDASLRSVIYFVNRHRNLFMPLIDILYKISTLYL